MVMDAFDEPLNFGGAKLIEGKKYPIELTGIVKKVQVVNGSTYLKGKGVIGKEYEKLTDSERAIVDGAPKEFWDKKDNEETAREKAKFRNVIIFQFREPESDTKFLYDASFDMTYPDNFPMKSKTSDLRGFVTKVFGMPVQGDEGFKWGDLFKKGDKFVATTYRKDGFSRLNVDSIMKEELSGPVVAGDGSNLSGDAQKLLGYIKTALVGQPFASVLNTFDTGADGLLGPANDPATYTRTHTAWSDIRKSNVKYTIDGKTFGFE
ncbi:MAG: hypothetical protein PHU71_07080 [Candidatus Gracilibacteria bacterium]|nr:hypothetical protein [Candidatus Gracilibacteria bacterium]